MLLFNAHPIILSSILFMLKNGIITVVIYSRGSDGSGQTKSFVLSGQNSLILLYRYHCLSSGKPGGVITAGRSAGDGLHDVSFNKLILRSTPLLLFSHPGLSAVKRKCCIFEMPLRAVLMTLSLSKKPLQS